MKIIYVSVIVLYVLNIVCIARIQVLKHRVADLEFIHSALHTLLKLESLQGKNK